MIISWPAVWMWLATLACWLLVLGLGIHIRTRIRMPLEATKRLEGLEAWGEQVDEGMDQLDEILDLMGGRIRKLEAKAAESEAKHANVFLGLYSLGLRGKMGFMKPDGASVTTFDSDEIERLLPQEELKGVRRVD